jgi:hypothetical protein
MDCVHAGKMQTWCGVGFKNAANDSDKHVKDIQKKFREDVDSARENNAKLKGFVFVTNVHLTDAKKHALKKYAGKKGFVHIEIFTREDLGGVLNTISGFPSRLAYLGIEMTKEDQLAFVNQYQQQLVEIITNERQTLMSQLERLQFLEWASTPINEIELVLTLKRKIAPKDLGEFRICMQIVDVIERSLNLITLLGSSEARGKEHGCLSRLRSNGDEILADETDFSPLGKSPRTEIVVGIHRFFEKRPKLSLLDLHRRDFCLHVTKNVAALLDGVTLMIDSYLVLQAYGPDLATSADMLIEPDWNTELSQAEAGRWREILLGGTIGYFDWQKNVPVPLF